MRKSGYRMETLNLIKEKQTPTYQQLHPLNRWYHSEEGKKIYVLSSSVNVSLATSIQVRGYNVSPDELEFSKSNFLSAYNFGTTLSKNSLSYDRQIAPRYSEENPPALCCCGRTYCQKMLPRSWSIIGLSSSTTKIGLTSVKCPGM
jgi:hypothetical protein